MEALLKDKIRNPETNKPASNVGGGAFNRASRLREDIRIRHVIERAKTIGLLPFDNVTAEINFVVGLARLTLDDRLAAMYVFAFRADCNNGNSKAIGLLVACKELLKRDLREYLWAIADIIFNEYLDDSFEDRAREKVETMAGNQVFVSYAHEDEAWLKMLQMHVEPLVRLGAIAPLWDSTKIKPGARWRAEIRAALKAAKVAVLMVSPYFLASDFIAKNELPPLLAEAKKGGLIILWFPITESAVRQTEIYQYQAVISPDRPLSEMPEAEQHKTFVKIAGAIATASK